MFLGLELGGAFEGAGGLEGKILEQAAIFRRQF
jgi:hypothetical protein